MIARIWRAWTTPERADDFEALFRTTIFPGIAAIAGGHGGYMLRREAGHEIEFVAITLFDTMDAVRAFAGSTPELPVIPPEVDALSLRFEDRVAHYDVALTPGST